MFERFTDRARLAVALAQEMARRTSHEHITTEHIALALLEDDGNLAVNALRQAGLDLDAVRQELAQIIGRGTRAPDGHIPFTPQAKEVIVLTLREALRYGDNHMGTEHMLLALTGEADRVLARVVTKLGADPNQIRELIKPPPEGNASTSAASRPPKVASPLMGGRPQASQPPWNREPHMNGQPANLVVIPDLPVPFSIGQFPTTMVEYQTFLDDTGWRTPDHWSSQRPATHDRMPVSWVNHFDANAYCYWLSRRHHRKFILPTTVMLQAAARSPKAVAHHRQEMQKHYDSLPSNYDMTERIKQEMSLSGSLAETCSSAFPWGDQTNPKLCNSAGYRPHRPGPTPVDRFGGQAQSGYGVTDLSGNLWEMSGSWKKDGGPVVHTEGNFFDPEGPYPDFMHFRGDWKNTLDYVESNLDKTIFAWEFQFDIIGGSYGTPAADCRTDRAGAWTSAANRGPYAGFRIACRNFTG